MQNSQIKNTWVKTEELKDTEEWEKVIEAFVELGANEYEGRNGLCTEDCYEEDWDKFTYVGCDQGGDTYHSGAYDGTLITKEELFKRAFGEGDTMGYSLEEERKKWFGKKYQVTPETSELLQKKIFELGGGWTITMLKDLNYINKPFLFVGEDGEITYVNTNQHEFFFSNALPEAKLSVDKVLVIEDNTEKVELEAQISEKEKELQELKDKLRKL